MLVQVLGAGCAKCLLLAGNAEAAAKEAKESGIDCVVEKVTDIVKIMSFDVIQTPALLIDGKLCRAGTVPTVSEIKTMILEAAEV